MGRFEDLTGMKFGEWIVKELDKESMEKLRNMKKQIKTLWVCQCSCGNIKTVAAGDLKNKKSLSCGHSKYYVIAKKVSEKKKGVNKYDLSGEYGVGYTENNKSFLFDLEDYDVIKDYYWTIHDGYAISVSNNDTIRMHRLIKNCPEDKIVDHINRNRSDNRKNNLRICVQEVNVKNISKRKDNKSGYTGISKSGNKWIVRISVNKKRITVGTYKDFEKAVEARKDAELKYWGEIIQR